MCSYDINQTELLKIFYTEIFPCKELVRWLTYDGSKCLLNYLY